MIVIGADTHKRSHALAAVDGGTGALVGERTIGAEDAGHRGALRWARALDGERVCAIEDCRHVSRRLEQAPVAAGERVIRVPPHVMGASRRGQRQPGTSDRIDALAVARAVLREGVERFPVAFLDEQAMQIQLLADHRDDLVGERTRAQNRLRWPRRRAITDALLDIGVTFAGGEKARAETPAARWRAARRPAETPAARWRAARRPAETPGEAVAGRETAGGDPRRSGRGPRDGRRRPPRRGGGPRDGRRRPPRRGGGPRDGRRRSRRPRDGRRRPPAEMARRTAQACATVVHDVPFVATVLTLLSLALSVPPGPPSRAVGQPWHGRLINGVQLPASGAGWVTWDPIRKRLGNRPWRRWGTDRLVATVTKVVGDYARRHPQAPPILIGDLSRPTGGDFGPRFGGLGHISHQNGLDADIYYPRRDGRLRRAARPQQVDREAAQELTDAFVDAGAEYVFVGPSLHLHGPRKIVQVLAHHDDHLHFRLTR